MSFILDALKKSETDRQRQGGPALFEVKVAPPRTALPLWAVAIAVLFAVNLVVVGWLLVRRAPPAAEAALPPPPAPAAGTPSAPAQAAAVPVTPPAPALTATAPAVTAVASAPPAAGYTNNPADAGAPSAPANADDFAPAAEPSPSGNAGRVKRGTDAGVPLYQQVATTPNTQVPQLRLDLHAYADRPEDRWVLINMHKLREGDSLEGVRVERITPDGAVLSWQGSRFLLTQN